VYLNPFSRRWDFDRETVDQVAQTWWIALLAGLISIVFGACILAIDWSVDSLALFVGLMFALQGIAWASAQPLEGGSRTPNYVLGAIGIGVGIAVTLWPEIGLLTLAVFIGAWFVVSGVIRIVGALANRHVPYWWLVLTVGLLEVPLGIWALRRPGMTLAILITITGLWSIVTGIWQIVIAFELRNLPRRHRDEAEPLAPRAAT
jgi:uncharacterized membrane protein HdeD (DUF308 family)